MLYEWDPKKAQANLRKHRVSFDEAASVFTDPLALTFDDPSHSVDEERFITIGTSNKQRVLFLAHADHGEDHVRIIRARSATKTESHGYQESRKSR